MANRRELAKRGAWLALLALLAAPLGARGSPALPEIAEIDLQLPRDADIGLVRGLIGVHAGQSFSRREVRRSIERLFATGKFSDVRVLVAEVGSGLRLTFQLFDKQQVGSLDIEGSQALDKETLLRALRVAPGDELYPERIERAVEALKGIYARAGYLDAAVQSLVVPGEQRVQVTFRIDEGKPTRVRAIAAAGNPGLDTSELVQTLGIGPGHRLDLDRLDRGIERLRARLRKGGYFRARVGKPEIIPAADGWVLVSVPVDAGPKMRIAFEGSHWFTPSQLEAQLGYDGEDPLDYANRERLAQKLRDFFRLQGFFDAQVAPDEIQMPDGARALALFRISEGKLLRVGRVQFLGLKQFDAKLLRQIIDEELDAFPESPGGAGIQPGEEGAALSREDSDARDQSGHIQRARLSGPIGLLPDRHQVYYEEAYLKAIERMADMYRAEGFRSAELRLGAVRIDEARRAASVDIEVREGVRTLISGVEFPGLADAETLQKAVAFIIGAPLSVSAVENARIAVSRDLAKRGYIFARVEDRVRPSEDRTRATVDLLIMPGPQVKVGKVIVNGLGRTREDVVRQSMTFKEGEVLGSEGIEQSQRNLSRLGIFQSASLRTFEPEVPEPVKDVVVDLQERPAWFFDRSVGYSIIDGPRAILHYSFANLFGRALQFNAEGKLNYFNGSYPVVSGTTTPVAGFFDSFGRRFNVGLRYPRILSLLPAEVGAHLDLVNERVNRKNYDFTRSSAILGGDLVPGRNFSLSLQYEIESDYVTRTAEVEDLLATLNKTDLERLRFPDGRTYLQSLKPSVSLDFRDDPVNPHRGIAVGASTELVKGSTQAETLGGKAFTPVTFVKAAGAVSFYQPLGVQWVLAFTARAGRIYHVEGSLTPTPKRFFLGGAGTLRGFKEDALLPQEQRDELHEAVRQCQQTLVDLGCDPGAKFVARQEQVPSEGGEVFGSGRAELRFPLFGDFEGALFGETGNLWRAMPDLSRLVLRYVVGSGLRLVTPIGPAALDLGVNLTQDRQINENLVEAHFSIGLF